MTIKLDQYQKQFLDAVVSTRRPVLCRSVAGGGKTTMNVMSCAGLIANGYKPHEIQQTCFNRANADDLTERVPHGVSVLSFDQIAWRSVFYGLGMQRRRKAGNWEMDKGKYKGMAKTAAMWHYTNTRFSPQQNQDIEAVEKLAEYCLYTLTDHNNWDKVTKMAEDYALQMPEDECFGRECVPKMIEAGLATARDTDAQNSGGWTSAELRYLVATDKSIPVDGKRLMFVDEVQDVNRATMKMLRRIPSERQISVGDIDQQIYVWLGADRYCWDRLAEIDDTIVVDSFISYRLPRSVVEVAQKFVSRIQAAPTAKDGKVSLVKPEKMKDYIAPGHVFITMTNADAVMVVIRCIEYGIPAYVKGKDVCDELLSVVDAVAQYKEFKFDTFVQTLNEWKGRQIAIAMRTGNPDRLIAKIADKKKAVEALYMGAYIKGVRDIAHLNAYIKDKFNEKSDALKVMALTAWKAKGFEYENVWVFKKDLEIPSTQDWKTTERRHAAYVAVTRTLDHLHILTDDKIPSVTEMDSDYLDFGDA